MIGERTETYLCHHLVVVQVCYVAERLHSPSWNLLMTSRHPPPANPRRQPATLTSLWERELMTTPNPHRQLSIPWQRQLSVTLCDAIANAEPPDNLMAQFERTDDTAGIT